MKKAAKLIVQGTTQGFFFRQFIKENSESLNLKGFVRNLNNGDLEVIVEGENYSIDKLEKILRRGPKHSNIRNVIREEKKWTGDFLDFKILRC